VVGVYSRRKALYYSTQSAFVSASTVKYRNSILCCALCHWRWLPKQSDSERASSSRTRRWFARIKQ